MTYEVPFSGPLPASINVPRCPKTRSISQVRFWRNSGNRRGSRILQGAAASHGIALLSSTCTPNHRTLDLNKRTISARLDAKFQFRKDFLTAMSFFKLWYPGLGLRYSRFRTVFQKWRCVLVALNWILDPEKRDLWCRALLQIWICEIKRVFGQPCSLSTARR